MSGRGPKRKYEARCPEPAHADAKVIAKGRRETAQGIRRRFLCTPKAGQPHTFSLIDGLIPMPVHSRPPGCPEHPGSKVVRNGMYGTSPARKGRGPVRPGARPHQASRRAQTHPASAVTPRGPHPAQPAQRMTTGAWLGAGLVLAVAAFIASCAHVSVSTSPRHRCGYARAMSRAVEDASTRTLTLLAGVLGLGLAAALPTLATGAPSSGVAVLALALAALLVLATRQWLLAVGLRR